MAARLGNVFYWAGCLIAAATIILGGAITVSEDYSSEPEKRLVIMGFAVGVAAVSWAAGRACRYVLGGK